MSRKVKVLQRGKIDQNGVLEAACVRIAYQNSSKRLNLKSFSEALVF